MRSLRTLLVGTTMASLLSACAGIPITMQNRVTGATVSGTGRPISAEACGFQLLLFIPIGINDRLARAYGLLQAYAAGDPITNVEVQESWTYYGLVGTQYCTQLHATAIRSQPAPAIPSAPNQSSRGPVESGIPASTIAPQAPLTHQDQTPPASGLYTVEQYRQHLKSQLDTGAITQEEYDRRLKRLNTPAN